MLFLRLMAVFWMVSVLTGCALLLPPPIVDERANFLLDRLAAQNQELKQFKGLAKVQMASAGRSRSGRIAYAAIRPDKMRVELLSTLGTPLTSLAGDGEHISIRSHADDKHYRIRQSRTALEQVIDLPLGLEDLQTLLSGRVPLPLHAFAAMMGTPGLQQVVDLKNRWHGLVAKLWVDSTTHQIQALKVYDADSALRYQIQWDQWREFKGFMLPHKVTIESAMQQRLIIWIERFWPNPAISPSVFGLDPSHPKS